MEEALKIQIQYQLKKANKKLESAKKIFQNGLYEDAISRAYYAMFHGTKALLLTKNITTHTHSSTIAMFNQHFVKTGLFDTSYAKMLSYARELRENGDYDIEYEEDVYDAEIVLKDASDFLLQVEDFIRRSNI